MMLCTGVFVCVVSLVNAAGQSASRASVVGQSQRIDGSSFHSKKIEEVGSVDFKGGQQVYGHSLRAVDRLQRKLLYGYDRFMFPLDNLNETVHVSIDLTFRQILDLDEKNQVLRSLIWSRKSWHDDHFKWKPADYDGIKEIMLSADQVWRPDVVIYEETGRSSYNPRLPFVVVRHYGRVQWNEPMVTDTSCSVNTAFFPFDWQMCMLTYVSWTHELKLVDLIAVKNSKKITQDSMKQFMNTGEWILDEIIVTKQVAEYSVRVQEDVPTEEDMHDEDGELTNKVRRFAVPPKDKVNQTFMSHTNNGQTAFAELKFLIFVRRNSSLYMQSMLFPGMVLSTVAIFGFYLPPDSGERVGLQITILLTFMVFLLTVTEMFPASTGPYIGVYFLMCMGMLGLNILMTIIVMHIHFKPCADLSTAMLVSEELKKSFHDEACQAKCGTKPAFVCSIPPRLRLVLQFFGKFWNISEEGAGWMLPLTKDEQRQVWPWHRKKNTYAKPKSCKQVNINLDNSEPETKPLQNGESSSSSDPDVKDGRGNGILKTKSSSCNIHEEEKAAERRRRFSVPPEKIDFNKSDDEEQNKVISSDEEDNSQASRRLIIMSHIRRKNGTESHFHQRYGSKRKAERKAKLLGISMDLDEDEIQEKLLRKREIVQEEWKSVSRVIDRLFFRIYMVSLLIGHGALFGHAYYQYGSMDIHSDHSSQYHKNTPSDG